jgi:hypothetical protein
MTEEFLQYIWKFKNFAVNDLRTLKGEPIRLIKTGEHNSNAGPDFLNSQVMIGEVRWAGSVEIHTRASEWKRHGHSTDPAYDNVILHVVYENDLGGDENNIPVLELKDHIAENTLINYKLLLESRNFIPCEAQAGKVDEFTKSLWIDRILVERLESRLEGIHTKLEKTNDDWREVFYQYLGRNFGFKVNSEAFERLTESIPMRTLAKHKGNLKQIEALLFGQAGFLEGDHEDEYPKALKKEYGFLQKKYGLLPLKRSQWKFLRMRPDNFPSCRIAEFAALVNTSENLFSKILDIKEIKDIEKLFEAEASQYWNTHYIFDKAAAKSHLKVLGKQSIENILINTVTPMLYAYGHFRGKTYQKEKALRILEATAPEKNNITNRLELLGFENNSASQSQGLLHLKKEYCDKKRCLSCAVGVKVLK